MYPFSRERQERRAARGTGLFGSQIAGDLGLRWQLPGWPRGGPLGHWETPMRPRLRKAGFAKLATSNQARTKAGLDQRHDFIMLNAVPLC